LKDLDVSRAHLAAYDPAFDSYQTNTLPEFDARKLGFQFVTSKRPVQPWMLIRVKDEWYRGNLMRFASAGAYGNPYKTWLKVANVEPAQFTKEKPIWTNRPAQ
jgi:hypothetical protein